MPKHRLTILTVCWIALIPVHLAALQGSNPTEEEVQKLSKALADLKQKPNDPTAQQSYIETFPQTYTEFLQLFDYQSPLADGHEYLFTLESLASTHKEKVGSLLVQLAKDAHYEADAPSYLQHATAMYGATYPNLFATLLKQLSSKDRMKSITFLADVENHASYSQYAEIIKEFKAQNEVDLAQQFEEAREKREGKNKH